MSTAAVRSDVISTEEALSYSLERNLLLVNGLNGIEALLSFRLSEARLREEVQRIVDETRTKLTELRLANPHDA